MCELVMVPTQNNHPKNKINIFSCHACSHDLLTNFLKKCIREKEIVLKDEENMNAEMREIFSYKFTCKENREQKWNKIEHNIVRDVNSSI